MEEQRTKDTIVELMYSPTDIEDLAEEAGIPPKVALERATRWGKQVEATAAKLCDEQLLSVIEGDLP